MNRRTLIIAGIVLVLVLLAIGAYLLFFRDEPQLSTDGAPIGGLADDVVGGRDVLPDGTEFAEEAGTEIAPRLVRITDGPVAFGSVAVVVPAATTTVTTTRDDGTVATTTVALPPDVEVRFVERQSGNLYAYRAHERTLTRLTNQTVPGVIEASWLEDGSRAFLRFFSTDVGSERLETYALPISGEGGYFLEQDLAQVSAGSVSVFSLLTSTTGSTGTIANGDGGNVRTVFTSPLASLRVAFAGDDFVATTKASASIDGYSFFVPRASGAFSRVLGPLRGLTALPDPTGSLLLYSYLTNGTFAMALFDLETRESVPLPVATIASKCVWSADGSVAYCAVPTAFPGTLPDDWYQGVVSFTDRIWRIDAAARVATLLVDPSTAGGSAVDAVALTIDPQEDFLVFTNRIDGSLWAYDL